MQLRFVGCGDALGSDGRSNTSFHVNAKRLVPTHMSDDMLARLGELPHTAADDGMVVEL
jgi:hypothetical protein